MRSPTANKNKTRIKNSELKTKHRLHPRDFWPMQDILIHAGYASEDKIMDSKSMLQNDMASAEVDLDDG